MTDLHPLESVEDLPLIEVEVQSAKGVSQPIWLMLGVLGTAFSFTSVLLVFFSPWFVPVGMDSRLPLLVGVICVLVVLVISVILFGRVATFLHRQALAAAVFALFALGTLSTLAVFNGLTWMPIFVPVVLIVSALTLLALLFAVCLSTIRRGVIGPFMATTFLIIGISVSLAFSLQDAPRMFLSILLPIIAIAIFVVINYKLLRQYDRHAPIGLQTDYYISKRSLFCTLITGLPVGVAASYVDVLDTQTILVALVVGIPLLLCSVVMIADALHFKAFSEAVFLRVFPVVVTPPFFFLPFLPPIGKLICCAYIMAVITGNTIICFVTISEITSFNRLSSFKVFGVSWFFYAVGFALGILMPWAVQWMYPGAVSETALILGFAYVIIFSGLIFQDNSVVDDSSSLDIGAVTKSSSWKEKVTLVAELYELSPRQQEVLRMLARGRNAKYLQEHFFISRSTAKAHIGNIYKRLDVHSQQELIDFIENIDSKKH